MFTWSKAKQTDWYQKGGMVGYQWGKRRLNELEEIIKDPKLKRTKIQKFIIKNALDFAQDDWHYFNNFSSKDVSHLKHVLKKINKNNAVSELHWVEARSGMLRTPLTKTLHVLAYKLQPEKYLEYQTKDYKFYGMDDRQAKQRALNVVKRFEKDMRYKW